MIKVLHFVASIGSTGGVQSLLNNYYEKMDRSEIHFDFAVYNAEMKGFEQKFIDKDCKIYQIPPMKEGLIEHINSINCLLRSNNYDIVHTHQNFRGALTVLIAKVNKIPVRIIHSHRANAPESRKLRVIRFLMTILAKLFGNEWWACGEDAAKWLYGKKALENKKVHILHNAIDTEKYAYNQQVRDELRSKLKLQNKLVVGNVGRFYWPKNHEKLIEIFKCIRKEESDSVLLLAGDGELKQNIENLVKCSGLEESVFFLGERKDVDELLQCMDVFVLPSRFEGLPVVLVEAQCAGLPCITGANITREVNVTDNIVYMDQNATDIEWAKEAIHMARRKRSDRSKQVAESGFDIKIEAMSLQSKYRECVRCIGKN